ncbi:MAG: TonB family protein [Candidatus Eisenbacteria bacterium]
MFAPEWSRSAHEMLRLSYRRSVFWSGSVAVVLVILAALCWPPYTPASPETRIVPQVPWIEPSPIIVPPPPATVVRPEGYSGFTIDPWALPGATIPELPDPWTWTPPALPEATEFLAIPKRLPTLVYRPALEYPSIASQSESEGRVEILVTVDESGRVVEASIYWSDVSPALELAALTAARGCLFEPGRQRGVPVPCRVILPFDFVIH